jgi:hypothetical protein
MGIYYDGKAWRIYYYHISNFENELKDFGGFLDEIQASGESPTAIIPNVGRPSFGSYAGIVGFAVLVKKGDGTAAPSGASQ